MVERVRDVLEDLNKQLGRIERSVLLLDEVQIWRKGKDSLNSIGNLILHLAGNEYQNLVSAIGNRPFVRERTREFTTSGGLSKEDLLALLYRTRSESERVLQALTEDDLAREVTIRYDVEDWKRMYRREAQAEEAYETRTVGRLLVQVAAHYGYHTGQIVLLAKMLRDTNEHLTGQYH